MPWALVLSDGKPGHENQSIGVLPKGLAHRVFPVTFHGRGARLRASLAARLRWRALAGRFPWHGLIGDGAGLMALAAERPSVVVSAGSGPAPINLLLARHLRVPAVTCMTPSVGLGGFDLALVPRHDHPPDRPNVVVTLGAPNRVDPDTLRAEGEAFRARHGLPQGRYAVLLMGGDSARFRIGVAQGLAALEGCLALAARHGMELLVTTSRRTAPDTEAAMAALAHRCAYFCAGRDDPERVVPGMLALAELAVVTEDSVSMVSEAASAPARVLALGVERKGGVPRRHEAVLAALADGGYVRRATTTDLIAAGSALLAAAPPPRLDDTARCRAAVARLIGVAP
ncbi:MAG: mitochondrial fission ELM1 family protein [Nitrospirae bacterium]|nr:mitochondrial fission ELM1 family protein [Nitrospirota bacterium]